MNSHDFRHLVARWRPIARRARLRMDIIADSAGWPVYVLEPRSPRPGAPALYLSAGIHGDEPAGAEALVGWAARSTAFLADAQVTIFPCLNPWGLKTNCRFDSAGNDLNRCFHRNDIPQIAAQKRRLAGRRFAIALCLHEDYDARGAYVYEIAGRRPYLAGRLLAAASRHIPVESRTVIETRRCRHGIIRPTISPGAMPEHPEAFFLHFHCTDRTLTLETPSELSIHDRVAAHTAALDVTAAATAMLVASQNPAAV